MTVPAPDTLLALIKQEPLTKDAFIGNLTTVMSDSEKVKQNYRGGGLFSFYVEGYMYDHDHGDFKQAMKTAGWAVNTVAVVQGYMPEAKMHDFRNADYDNTNVQGYSWTIWSHVQMSKLPTP